MSGAQEVVCEGWLRKSPPEKKLRRYAWKKRWFVLRSGRLSGEPDVLQYYKSQHSRRPIRTINLNLCEQVDAGLSFTKKELESSFVFDLKTEERTWYLVAESEEDMNRWVTSICLLCGFNQTHDAPKRPPTSITSTTPTSGNAAVTMETGLVPPPYDPVRVNPDSNAEEDYLLLSHCQSHNRPTSGSSISVDTDYNDNPHLSAVSSSSSSSSSPSLLPNSLPPPPFSSGFKTAPWSAAAMTGTFSQSLDTCLTSDLQTHPRRPRCHPSPHPRKHSLDFHLRPVPITLSDDAPPISGYQIPRPVSSLQPRPLRRPSSTPSVELLTQAELNASTPTPPPRPPKPQTFAAQGDISAVVSLSPGRRDGWVEGGDGGLMKSNVIITPAHTQTGCDSVSITHSRSDRASMFEFSESFSSYFFNKGLVPLGSICSEEDDVDENYVPMSAATTEPPAVQREPPPPPADASVQLEGLNYVPMTPSQPAKPSSAIADQASLGKQVPPPAHMGFRNSPLTPLTSPVQRNTMTTEATPPPVHRNLKPQHKGGLISESGDRSKEPTHRTRVKPAPLDINPVQQDWQEVPPPVRSPVTRTFTRHPSCQRSIRPTSDHSSSPASDSDDPDESYITMTTSSPNFSAGEPSLRLMLHRASEGGVSSSPMPWRARDDKQVEYLDLDLHTGRSTSRRQKCCKTEGGNSGCEQADTDEECSRGGRSRVDYVVVDPKRTKALRNTREAWHDGRMSTEKEKC